MSKEKDVKRQLDELKVKGIIRDDPYIRVNADGRVVTVKSEEYKKKMEKIGKMLVRNTRLFHFWFHSGKWNDCNREICRTVLDTMDEIGLTDLLGEENE